MPSLALVAVLITLAAAAVLRWINRRSNIPPGPPAHWFWGNKFPQANDFIQYHEWSKQFGPVYTLRSGMQTVTVICGYKAAVDILEKNGAITSDRPRKVAGGWIRSGDMRILLVGSGERLKKLRRALHANFQARAASNYESIQVSNARQLIRDICENPEDIFVHTQRFAASVILSLTYGQPSPSQKSNPDVALMYEMLFNLGEAVRPGAWVVDQLPFLRHLPFYAQILRDQHKLELGLFRRQMQSVRNDSANGVAPESFGRYLLDNQDELDLSDDEIAYLAGSVFGAGNDTTAAGLRITIMAAACFPKAQRRVQEELDKVMGHDRLPSFADWDHLHYTRAFILETFRWRPGVAAGTQHRATTDIYWEGYRIPAGSTLIPNHWSIGRDPEFWPEGDNFVPERWLDENKTVQAKVAFPNFGFG